MTWIELIPFLHIPAEDRTTKAKVTPEDELPKCPLGCRALESTIKGGGP